MERRKAYQELRDMVKSKGGSMRFEKQGYQWGAWIIEIDGKTRIFRSNGSGYPELDNLYEPGVAAPKHYNDYTNTLVSMAWEKLQALLSESEY